jgi:hypothetical protein
VKTTFLKGVALGAVVASLTLVCTAAFAGTGVAAVFNLGKTNTVNGTSALSGSTNGQQLHVVNTNTGSAAAGIGIQTATNKPPLVVNSSQKVGHLNADLLDGLDSSALQKRITGSCPDGRAVTQVGSTGAVTCNKSYSVPISATAQAGNTTPFATVIPNGLSVGMACQVSNSSEVEFSNGTASTATFDYFYANGGIGVPVIDGSLDLLSGNTVESPFTNGEIVGQWTIVTPAFSATVSIHAIDHATSCKYEGTAQVALY